MDEDLMNPIVNEIETAIATEVPALKQEETTTPQTKGETKMDLSNVSVEELEKALEEKKAEEAKKKEEAQKNVDLNTLSDEELEEVLKKRKEAKLRQEEEEDAELDEEDDDDTDDYTPSKEEVLAEAQKIMEIRCKTAKAKQNKNTALVTLSMEEAFALAKEYEVDSEFSILFGFPNRETNWIRWIVDNNLDMKPFTTWYNSKGKKMDARPTKLTSYGWFSGWAKITLVSGADVIQTVVTSDGGHLFPVLYDHCR